MESGKPELFKVAELFPWHEQKDFHWAASSGKTPRAECLCESHWHIYLASLGQNVALPKTTRF